MLHSKIQQVLIVLNSTEYEQFKDLSFSELTMGSLSFDFFCLVVVFFLLCSCSVLVLVLVIIHAKLRRLPCSFLLTQQK